MRCNGSPYNVLPKKDNRMVIVYRKLLKSLELTDRTFSDVRALARRGYSYLTSALLALSLCLLIVRPYDCYASIPEVNLSTIAQIESSNNPRAIGDDGRSFGLYQLSQGVVDEFNDSHKTSYKADSDALEPITATQIAKWYFDVRIPQILKSLKRPITLKNVLVCYNAGCGRLSNPPASTKAYIAKYRRLSHG